MISVREIAGSGAVVIDPGQRLTSENANEFLDAVKAFPAGIDTAFVVNLEHTAIVDSSGVGSLVSALKHVQASNSRLALAGLRPELLRSFRLMNLHQVFDLYETEQMARQYMNGQRS